MQASDCHQQCISRGRSIKGTCGSREQQRHSFASTNYCLIFLFSGEQRGGNQIKRVAAHDAGWMDTYRASKEAPGLRRPACLASHLAKQVASLLAGQTDRKTVRRDSKTRRRTTGLRSARPRSQIEMERRLKLVCRCRATALASARRDNFSDAR